MKEVWKDIPSCEGFQASNLGNIRRLESDGTYKPKTISRNNKSGYLYVHVGYTAKDYRNRYVHRMVVEAFLGPIDPNKEVDNINTIKSDNRLINLRVVTRKENVNNPLSIKHLKESCKGRVVSDETRRKMSELRKGKPVPEATMIGLMHGVEKNKRNVSCYGPDGKCIGVYPSIKQAGIDLGISRQSISSCLNGRCKRAHGLIWKYVK